MPRFASHQRARILAAAIPVFAAQGLEGGAIRRVGHAAGVNSALLYYYFENKQTLFVEAVHFVMRGLMEHLARRGRAFRDGRDRLEFLVHGLLDYAEAHPERMKLMALAAVRHAELVAESIQRFVQEGRPLPLDVLLEGLSKGELRPAHPLQTWWSIVGMCVFSLEMREVTRHVDPRKLPVPLPRPGETGDQIVRLVCDGLATPARPRRRRNKPAHS